MSYSMVTDPTSTITYVDYGVHALGMGQKFIQSTKNQYYKKVQAKK